jgi:hypothetical protein
MLAVIEQHVADVREGRRPAPYGAEIMPLHGHEH